MINNLQETKTWLRIEDGGEEDTIIELIMGAAEEYLKDATGKKFTQENKRAKLFCLVLTSDWYENRELIGKKPSEKVRYSIQSMLGQLQYTTEGVETDEV